ncbi:MAG: hypothetical protein RI973_2247 [Bacteroidota bacterium]|jgi:outer membrane protein OmpA-like peptidoglycan-associated protein
MKNSAFKISATLLAALLFPAIGIAQVPEKAYAKFDFIPGENVLFEDNFLDESPDEIPSYWIVNSGRVEIAKIGGEMVLGFLEGSPAALPRQKDNFAYPDRLTLEFDFLWRHNSKSWVDAWNDGTTSGGEYIDIRFANDEDYYYNSDIENLLGDFYSELRITSGGAVSFKDFQGNYSSGEKVPGAEELYADLSDKWVHASIAISEKSLKVYLNSQRVLNAPIGSGKVRNFLFKAYAGSEEYESQAFVKNVRIAQGGANPYKQLTAEGKIIARGINFDTGKSTLKPESLGALNSIVNMMKEHAELKLEVSGHTDSDGDDASNMKLSQARADAVREKLISLGIDPARLTSKGYGETMPISPNSTPAGKANNRRVELLKKS